MDDDKIKKVVESLDHAVPKDGALANFYIYGGGEDETAVIANKLGYLRLGTEFLKAAYAESVENTQRIQCHPYGYFLLGSPRF